MYLKSEEIKLLPVTAEEGVQLKQILKTHYDLDVLPDKLERFSEKTASSRVYRCGLKDGSFVVVKKSFWYDTKTQEDFSSAIRSLEKAYSVSEALRLRGVPLPKALTNVSGKYTTVHSPDLLVALEYVEGKHLASRSGEFSAGGRALGLFHKKGKEYLEKNPVEWGSISQEILVEKPYEESRSLYFSTLRPDLLKSHTCDLKEVCDAVRSNLAVLDKTIGFIDHSGINSDPLSRGIVHNDFHVNNALFHDDGSLAIFLDIDQLGIAPHIWDMGNTLASYASNYLSNNDEEKFPKKAASFLMAYHKEFPLSLAEYKLSLAATQRWDVMRILRSMRRHHYENNRLPDLLPKIKDRLIPRILAMPRVLSFVTDQWLSEVLNNKT